METELNKSPHRARCILCLGLLLALVLLSALVYKLSGASTAEYESHIEEYTAKVIAKHGQSFVLHQPAAQREKLKTRHLVGSDRTMRYLDLRFEDWCSVLDVRAEIFPRGHVGEIWSKCEPKDAYVDSALRKLQGQYPQMSRDHLRDSSVDWYRNPQGRPTMTLYFCDERSELDVTAELLPSGECTKIRTEYRSK